MTLSAPASRTIVNRLASISPFSIFFISRAVMPHALPNWLREKPLCCRRLRTFSPSFLQAFSILDDRPGLDFGETSRVRARDGRIVRWPLSPRAWPPNSLDLLRALFRRLDRAIIAYRPLRSAFTSIVRKKTIQSQGQEDHSSVVAFCPNTNCRDDPLGPLSGLDLFSIRLQSVSWD